MLYITFTTGKCNLSCKYCGGSFNPKRVPWSVQYSLHKLKGLIESDPGAVVAFYGGEPLLNAGFVKWVMDNVSAKHFVIQTNGTLFRSLEVEYWLRFGSVLLSLDGIEELTDKYRGRGVYARVLEAASSLREWGFRGDLIARMTVTEDTDIYRDVMHILSLGLFSHVHWQLDVVWSDRWGSFPKWRDESYIPGLSRLAKLWLSMAENGVVLGVAPFKAILSQHFWGVYSSPPCGAGIDSFAVLTDGTLLSCPIAVEEEWSRVGSLEEGLVNPRAGIGEPCTSCVYFTYCGGRCLYAYKERLWGEEGFREVCRASQALIDIVLRMAPRVRELLSEGIISEEDIRYPPFNNTVEVIP
ncbi:MAG: TIGR04084 family radical SAM/SPASM domain-containing protein [Thermofilum sp.]